MKSNFKAIQNNLKYYPYADFPRKKVRLEQVRVVWMPEIHAYVCHSEYAQRDVPKNAGFQWSPIGKFWFTRDAKIANNLINKADKITRENILKAIEDGEIVSVE